MTVKVFYIDDEFEICENFKDTFACESVLVRTFTDPEEAINEAFVTVPDIIFVDFRFPKTSGDDVAQRLPSSPPKYLVTGDINVKCNYPFVRTLIKPTDPDEIERLLAERRKELGYH